MHCLCIFEESSIDPHHLQTLCVVIIEKGARTLGLGVDGGHRERARASNAGGRDCVGRGPATEEGAEGRAGEEGQHRGDEVGHFPECSWTYDLGSSSPPR